ncbi:hypothetical protein JW758_00050 [Candidatus Peregrinibacteria bacterium]|nr:hypothetical protein [Candidatus Peregrinibacteria bacterium]
MNIKTLKKILNVVIPPFLFCLFLFVVLKTAYAQSYLPEGWDTQLGGVKNFAVQGQTGEELAAGFIKNAIRIVRILIGGVALIMGILYGMSLIFARGKEEVIAKQKSNFLYVLIGFVILIISENVATIFNPEKATSDKLIDFKAANDQLREVMNYVKWMLGSVIVLFMTISSIRMITAGGEEEMITKQKKNLTWSVIGMMVILLASSIVNAIYVTYEETGVTEAGSPGVAVNEIGSIIRLILVFLGPVAIAFTIYAGFMYLTSFGNDERNQKAKKMIIGGITGVVIIFAAYALVNTITAEKLAMIPTYLMT